jgi:hypothetical protein
MPWNIALVVDPNYPDRSLTFSRVGPVPEVPFAATESPVTIRGQARVVNAWGYASDGSAAPPPQSPIDCTVQGACGDLIDVTLVPYGTTHLRITEIPYTLA